MEGFMSIPKIAGIIALVGFAGFVASSLAHAGPGDLIFNLAAVCLIIAPFLFLGCFIVEACREIASIKQLS
jgi:hypothetical protein